MIYFSYFLVLLLDGPDLGDLLCLLRVGLGGTFSMSESESVIVNRSLEDLLDFADDRSLEFLDLRPDGVLSSSVRSTKSTGVTVSGDLVISSIVVFDEALDF